MGLAAHGYPGFFVSFWHSDMKQKSLIHSCHSSAAICSAKRAENRGSRFSLFENFSRMDAVPQNFHRGRAEVTSAHVFRLDRSVFKNFGATAGFSDVDGVRCNQASFSISLDWHSKTCQAMLTGVVPRTRKIVRNRRLSDRQAIFPRAPADGVGECVRCMWRAEEVGRSLVPFPRRSVPEVRWDVPTPSAGAKEVEGFTCIRTAIYASEFRAG
jgi:hypothetical protein